MIELSKDLHCKGYGRFPEHYLKTEHFRDRLQEFTASFQKIGTTYLNQLGNDKKVTGLEKKTLTLALEELFTYALLLRKVDFASGESIFKIERKSRLLYLTVQFPSEQSWEIAGHMRPEYTIKGKNFREVFNGILAEDCKKFLGMFGRALVDKVITPEEKESLRLSLDSILLSLIETIVFVEAVMRFQ